MAKRKKVIKNRNKIWRRGKARHEPDLALIFAGNEAEYARGLDLSGDLESEGEKARRRINQPAISDR
jgi:hypothetical protein